MSSTFKRIAIVSLSTIGSRILGLLRDVLQFSLLGTGVLNSAFLLAFSFPNLFRRLLGEGALSSAVIPVMAEEHELNGNVGSFSVLNKVMTRLGLVLLGLILLICGVFWAMQFWPGLEDRWYYAFNLGIVLFPYILFVCVAALFAATLNVLHRFGLAALSQVWLNLSMIACLGGLGWFLGESEVDRVGFACLGIFVGGLAQILIPIWELKHCGWKPSFDLSPSPSMHKVMRLFAPGLMGAAIMQINMVVSRLLAFGISASAVSILYLANRLIELPLGVFATAVTTVLFPGLARSAARKDFVDFSRSYAEGNRIILAITVPAAVGLMILNEPILRLLFLWGKFTGADVAQTLMPLNLYSAAIPFYALATMSTRAFHALQDMKTPVRAALINFIINVVLSVSFMIPWGMNGLALANTLAVVFQSAFLAHLVIQRIPGNCWGQLVKPLGKILLAASIMGLSAYLGRMGCEALISGVKLSALVAVSVVMPLAIVIYFTALDWLKFQDMQMLRKLIGRFVNRSRSTES
jgi:putative peptidoglycan lipid II flippase